MGLQIFFEYVEIKNETQLYDFLNCQTCYAITFDEELKNSLENTIKYCDGGLNIFILLLEKGCLSLQIYR